LNPKGDRSTMVRKGVVSRTCNFAGNDITRVTGALDWTWYTIHRNCRAYR
jgi:hypothetical protein